MATLQEKRQASGRAMEAARRQIGVDNENGRRALGQAMIERRTGKSQAEDLNALVNAPRQRQSLTTQQPRGSVAPVVGKGSYTAPAASSGGSGIASPLTVQRITYAEEPSYVPTFDASGYFAVKKIASMLLTDAEGTEIVLQGFDKLDENGSLIVQEAGNVE